MILSLDSISLIGANDRYRPDIHNGRLTEAEVRIAWAHEKANGAESTPHLPLWTAHSNSLALCAIQSRAGSFLLIRLRQAPGKNHSARAD
jgi:hypothetical protein